ncbi:MAG: hypothetical protein NDI69_11405 [Bacteriovoracaceae bacterium]|nr:hypothetical protein [Bacteriovoracaceae bacterium]
MKKQLTVALGLAVLATPVFASKARLQALGEDSYGSAYINDNRNIWLNAAQINNHKDLVTYEFGGNQTADSAGTARGEGGVYKAHGNFVYGAHFGGASNTANGMRAATGLTNADEDNNLDLFIGGDAGMKWGANLGYAKTADETSPLTAESMRTRLGVIMGDTQVYANINLINNAKGDNGAKFNGDLGYQVGAIHAWEGNTLFVDYRSFDAESEIGASKEDISLMQAEVGMGRVERLNDKTNLFAKASLFTAKVENDRTAGNTFGTAGCDASQLACEEYDTMRVPVVVGLETEATSWLTLRASVTQVVWGSEEDKNNERTIANSTAINAGATLKFGELSVDGVVGNGTGATNAVGENTATGNGTIRTDELMSRVSMTYRF